MVKYKTYVLKRMNMPFTIAFVKNTFDGTLIEALNQVIDEINKNFHHFYLIVWLVSTPI